MRGRRTVRACLAGVLVLTASGCWLQSGFGAGRTGANVSEPRISTANVATLAPAWDLPDGGSPVVFGDTVFVAAGDDVAAIDAVGGDTRWRVAGVGVRDVAVAGGLVWVAEGDTGCTLRALDQATGATVVTQAFGGNPFDSGPNGRSACGTTEVLVSGGTVMTTWSYVAWAIAPGACLPGATHQSGSGTVTLDATSGAVLSQTGGVGDPGCAPVPPAPTSTLSSDGAVTYMVTGNAITRFGTCGTGPCGPLPLPAGTSAIGPAVPAAGGRLVVTTTAGTVLVLDRATGAVRWSGAFATSSAAPPAVTPTTVYVTGADGVVAAFPLAGCGAATCSPSWVGTTSGEASGRPSVGGDVVYVAEGAGESVAAFAADGCGAPTCAPVTRIELAGASHRAPVIASGTLLVEDGEALAAYRLP